MKLKILLLSLLLSPGLSGIAFAGFDLSNIPNFFKEKNAAMTEFEEPDSYGIEEQRKGEGWRYFTFGDKLHKQVIIYNHGHRGRKKEYEKFAYDTQNKHGRGLYEKAQWYFENGVNFYAALRKETEDLHGDYGRRIEPIEVFYHMTNKVKQLHGEDVDICYVGHSEGGASVLYTSIFLEGRNVAISPSHNKYSVFKFTGKEFYESLEYYNQAKNLTVFNGGLEIQHSKKFRNMFRKSEELEHINTKLFKDFEHSNMAANVFLDEIGSAVLEACSFKN